MAVLKKEPDGPIMTKYPCNKPLKSEGMYSPTIIKECNHDCFYCGFNPEEKDRRLTEGSFVVNSKTGISTLVFPKRSV